MHGWQISLPRNKKSVRFLSRASHQKCDIFQIPKPDVVLVSSDIFVIESENLLDIQWDVAVLDARSIAKGGIARLANATVQTKCPHFVISGHVPTSELGLVNTLKLIDAKQAVRLGPVSCRRDGRLSS